MGDEEKPARSPQSLEDLLKSLEGHVVNSVEITREDIRWNELPEHDHILHVKIQLHSQDHIGHRILDPKDISFSILDVDVLGRILDYYHEGLRKISSSLTEISSNIEESKNTLSRKLLRHIKGTITETLRIRKPVEESDTVKTPLTFNKLLRFIKGTITETLRIRKPVEESDTVDMVEKVRRIEEKHVKDRIDKLEAED